jgi:hypothetical protein
LSRVEQAIFVELYSSIQWERITFSRLTTVYFIFSVVHCSIQVIFQVQAFSINDQAGKFLYSVLVQGNATVSNGFPVLGKHDLRICDHVPNSFSTSSCTVRWNGTVLHDNEVVSSNGSVFEITSTPISSSTSAVLSNFTRSTTYANIDNAAPATKTSTTFAIATAASSDDEDNGDDTRSKVCG